ncbi:MAG TPA: DsrE family protein [Nitrososphaerales archaeon]|nr:DsrE family protein [Nitrososphaerales archaeon]
MENDEAQKKTKKLLGIMLFTTPYSSENTDTVMKIARSALNKGHDVTIFAYGDSVHGFTKGQKATGMPNAATQFQLLIDNGLKVELCGTCLNFRGIGNELIIKGAEPSSMRNLCKLIDDCDRFLTFT